MTEENFPTRDIKIGEDWTVPNSDGPGRRVIVQGAAWTVPVIAMAVATPAAAASPQPSLFFTQPSYTGTTCSDITGVRVQLTTDGTTPAGPGQSITVNLPAGFKFSNGQTSYTDTTGNDGTILLPDIVAPATNKSSSFGATSGSLTATAPVTTTGETSVIKNFSGSGTAPALPAGVTVKDIRTTQDPTTKDYWVVTLGSDGKVRRFKSTSAGVIDAAWQVSNAFPTSTAFALTKSGGAGVFVTDGTTVKNFGGIATPALPGGVTVTDLQSTMDSSGNYWVYVIGSDKSAYRIKSTPAGVYDSAWTKSPSFPGSVTIHSPANDTVAGSWVTNGTSIKNFGGATTLPALPGGATVTDMQSTVDGAGNYIVTVLGSNGVSYRIKQTPAGVVDPAWSASTSFAGTATAIALSLDGGGAWVTDGTLVKNFSNSATVPPLPGGATIVDMQATQDSASGNYYVQVLGSDNNVYRIKSTSAGVLDSAWQTSPSFTGTANAFSIAQNTSAASWIVGAQC